MYCEAPSPTHLLELFPKTFVHPAFISLKSCQYSTLTRPERGAAAASSPTNAARESYITNRWSGFDHWTHMFSLCTMNISVAPSGAAFTASCMNCTPKPGVRCQSQKIVVRISVVRVESIHR